MPVKNLLVGLLLSIFLIACTGIANTPEPAIMPHMYTISDGPILNPERGFYGPYTLPGPAGFSPVRLTGITLVHVNVRLDPWRESDIPQDVLDGLEVNFADMRDGGVKAIVRFAYNAGPYPDTEPDASKEMILRHIQQLTPLLQNNADVIAWLEAGLIGAWGEWHTSTHGLDNLTDKQDILFALLDALPKSRTVQVRYPANIISMFPDVITSANAFDGSNQSRVGHHNDCFLSSVTDVGTYERDGVVTIERDQAYLTELTRFTAMSGETCAFDPPRSQCPNTLQEMALLHFSSINQAYYGETLLNWKQNGCMDEIVNRLGYRLALTSADFNEQVRPGGILNLTVTLSNTGFASIINERPLYVVLEGNQRYTVKVDQIDPRRWEGGQSASFTVQLRVPSEAAEGDYRLALWLPDAAETLRDDSRYAVQFANENVWDDAAGFNVLGNISIAETAGGASDSASELSVIKADVGASAPLAGPTPNQPAASQNDLLFNPQITFEADKLRIEASFVGDAASYNGYQVFFDTDQDPETGLAIEGVGADFLLENGSFNAYKGDGASWDWTASETPPDFSNDNQVAKWTLPRAALGEVTSFDVVFRLMDTNWASAFVIRKATYTEQ